MIPYFVFASELFTILYMFVVLKKKCTYCESEISLQEGCFSNLANEGQDQKHLRLGIWGSWLSVHVTLYDFMTLE